MKHKWVDLKYYNRYFKAEMISKRIKVCENCGIKKRRVMSGARYDFPDGTHKIGKVPPCKQLEFNMKSKSPRISLGAFLWPIGLF